MTDQMTDELNRAVEQGLSGIKPQRQVPRMAEPQLADMLQAVTLHNEGVKAKLDDILEQLTALRAKL